MRTLIRASLAEAQVVSKDVVLLPPALATLKRFVKMQIPGPP